MPTNVTAEYAAAEQEYRKASTTEEKIKALEKMLSTCPTHKGCEKLRQDIKTKLSKFRKLLKKQEEKKAKGFTISIKKEGSAQICLVGPSNSGKSLLLNKLTNKKVKVADYEFTTKMPEIGIMKYKGLKLQLIEVPSIFKGYYKSQKGPQFFSIIRNADLIVIVTDTDNIDYLFEEFDKARIKLNNTFEENTHKAIIVVNKKDLPSNDEIYKGLCRFYNFHLFSISALNDSSFDILKDEIWKGLGLIKIYTKEPGKRLRKDEPLSLKKDSTIKDMAVHLHKDFIKKFRFARIWGKSARFKGMQAGLNHKLEDDDVVEIHLK